MPIISTESDYDIEKYKIQELGTMFTLEVNGVHDAYVRLTRMVNQMGVKGRSRNGPVLALPGPLLMRVNWPKRRVIFHEERDANPIFHLMEALWMLAGRNDTAFVQQFNSNITSYSDDGTSFNAAYGFRWANHFGHDQLQQAADMLIADPQDRRVVISMWDGHQDLGSASKDIPCNLQMIPRVIDGRLHLTTTNRSNDLIWGLCGANFVHLSIVHEWLAAACGIPLGKWHHMSNNLHVYERHFGLIGRVKPDAGAHYLPYTDYDTIEPGGAHLFRKECHALVDGQTDDFDDPFLYNTAAPMLSAWRAYKEKDKTTALYEASCIDAWDWRRATIEWFQRRKW